MKLNKPACCNCKWWKGERRSKYPNFCLRHPPGVFAVYQEDGDMFVNCAFPRTAPRCYCGDFEEREL
jgi:hypothetical protein